MCASDGVDFSMSLLDCAQTQILRFECTAYRLQQIVFEYAFHEWIRWNLKLDIKKMKMTWKEEEVEANSATQCGMDECGRGEPYLPDCLCFCFSTKTKFNVREKKNENSGKLHHLLPESDKQQPFPIFYATKKTSWRSTTAT